MTYAPAATAIAKRMRPSRESGVVRGSEIMKKANSTSAPLASRWSGISSGSPSHSARPTTRAAWAARNVQVTSARAARFTTSPPAEASRKAKTAVLPHWPGETQTCPVRAA